MQKINGYIVAPFTPMHYEGSLNLDLVPDYASYLIRNKLDGVFTCGSTGEGALLTVEERKQVSEKWLDTVQGKLKVIVHTGGTNLKDQIELASHAQEIGAFATATMASAFLAPKRVQELGEFCAAIASAAPKLPFYYYHIPALNGSNIPMLELLQFADKNISNFAGVKYTHEDLHEFNQCFRHGDYKYELFYGLDETFLTGLTYGCTAGIGGTYNHCFTLYSEIKKAFDRGDLKTARERQNKSQLFVNVLKKFRGNIVGGKRIMKFLGLDCGPNRLPLQNISDEEEILIKTELNAINFFDFCNK